MRGLNMKKYFIACFIIIICVFGYYYLTFYTSFHLFSHKQVNTFITTNGSEILLNEKSFQIHAINLGSSIPGHDDKEFAIDQQTYLRWFKLIQQMNINTIRIYTIESPAFYKAFKEYNTNAKEPLYLIQGIDVGDYEKNSTKDYFDESLKSQLIHDVKMMVDVIHGKRIVPYSPIHGSGTYKTDVSTWTLGYIIGTEWNDVTVEYTNRLHESDNQYHGNYMKTSENAKPFERILAQVGDSLFTYESKKYGEQRLVSFGNTAQTDPFTYNEAISDYFNKFTTIDINRMETTEKVKSGIFASFQVYSGYPDYYSFQKETITNTYQAYLKDLKNHYQIPFVVTEFGYSTARGETINFQNDDFGHSSYTEEQQGNMIVSAIKAMKEVGIENFILYEWQDEWDKNVWNTIHGIDSNRSQYWHDLQTSTQSFGILAFEDGEQDTIVTIDGKKDEWKADDLILEEDGFRLSSKYDTTYLYILVEKEGFSFGNETFYIPFDVTSKSGSKKATIDNLTFTRDADFLLQIHGPKDTRLLVQERYNPLKAAYGHQLYLTDFYVRENQPLKDSPLFEDIKQITSFQDLYIKSNEYNIINKATLVDTGYLIYGNGNPKSKEFNSLSDFYYSEGILEIRIAWNLLNFADPSLMMIHDDYYENYGIETMAIDELFIGIGTKEKTIPFGKLSLKGWREKVTYHERLKKSYEIIQKALKEE